MQRFVAMLTAGTLATVLHLASFGVASAVGESPGGAPGAGAGPSSGPSSGSTSGGSQGSSSSSGGSGNAGTGNAGTGNTGNSNSDVRRSKTTGGASSGRTPLCPKGMVWDPNATFLFVKGRCVSAAGQQQGMIYDYGKSLAKAGHYPEAIEALRLAPDQDDPRVLNYLGYSHRKLGRMDEALAYYHAAVAQDPDFSLVREYLGEAYIQLGLLEKAREQLSAIERICGSKACGEYGMLAELIVSNQIDQPRR